ncbi:MAG: acetyl-CoA carboxylase biotin carboxyl carrier protein subunit [Sandaracinaceae bacterium]
MRIERAGTPSIDARAGQADGKIELLAPRPGWFRPAIAEGDVVRGNDRLGELEVLGRIYVLRAPAGAFGAVATLVEPGRARVAVDHRTVIALLDPELAGGAAELDARGKSASASGGPVFVAPLGGRYYARPSPDAEPFVKVGETVRAGQTVALIEVMKTFNRVQYAGEPAEVAGLPVKDGDDVDAGDVLLELEPA